MISGHSEVDKVLIITVCIFAGCTVGDPDLLDAVIAWVNRQ